MTCSAAVVSGNIPNIADTKANAKIDVSAWKEKLKDLGVQNVDSMSDQGVQAFAEASLNKGITLEQLTSSNVQTISSGLPSGTIDLSKLPKFN